MDSEGSSHGKILKTFLESSNSSKRADIYHQWLLEVQVSFENMQSVGTDYPILYETRAVYSLVSLMTSRELRSREATRKTGWVSRTWLEPEQSNFSHFWVTNIFPAWLLFEQDLYLDLANWLSGEFGQIASFATCYLQRKTNTWIFQCWSWRMETWVWGNRGSSSHRGKMNTQAA